MGYRAITVDDYIREPSQEEEQELQDRQQRLEELRARRRLWEVENKERVRELRGDQFSGEGEFEAWWEEHEKEGKRIHEMWKESQREWKERKRELRKMREKQEKRERERQEEERVKAQVYGPVERQVEETYIDDYYEYNDDY